jgi:hypothetical protein
MEGSSTRHAEILFRRTGTVQVVKVGRIWWTPGGGEDAFGYQFDLWGLNTREEALVRLVQDKLDSWVTEGKLPYSKEKMGPTEDRWWDHVRSLLIHNTRLGETTLGVEGA